MSRKTKTKVTGIPMVAKAIHPVHLPPQAIQRKIIRQVTKAKPTFLPTICIGWPELGDRGVADDDIGKVRGGFLASQIMIYPGRSIVQRGKEGVGNPCNQDNIVNVEHEATPHGSKPVRE